MKKTAAARITIRQSLLVAACLAATALPLFAQNAPGAPKTKGEKSSPSAQSFTESTEVLAVEVPVQVLDKDGEPVRGLKAEDFAVFDGRKQQPVTGFEILDLSTAASGPASTSGSAPVAAPKPAPVPASARRRFVLLFDLSFSSPPAMVKARQSAKTLLAGLHPSDLVAVASYSASRGPELVLGFTADHRQAEAALEHLGTVEVAADPLHLTLAPDSAGRIGSGEMGGGSRHGVDSGDASGGGLDINAVVNAAAERAALQSQQRDVTAFARAVGAFAKLMGGIHGRKYVVFLSEGFQDRLFLGTDDDAEIQAMDMASTRGQIWNVDSDARYGNTKLSGDLEKMMEELRRADCVVESVDPGGLRAYGGENGIKPAAGQNSLFAIANGTGGELYRNFNDLSVAMNQMLKRTSITYVLTYQPEGVKHDGEYHKLRVELKNAPRGTRVVYRPGYYAPKPFKDQTATERMLDAANRVVNGEEGGALTTSVLAAPFQGPGDKAYVPVLIEVDGKSLLAGSQGKALPVEIYTYALDDKGTVQDFFARTLGLDLAKVEPVLQKSGLKFYGDLRLAPGSYTLRVLVRNGTTGALSAKVLPLEVPAFAQPAAVLLPPFFPEAPGRWLMVRKSAEAPKDVPYPFQMQREPFIPAALPVLRPGEETKVALMGYHLQPGALKADSRIFGAEGEELGAGEVRLGQRQAGATLEPDRVTATFRPPALKPGSYTLVITLTDAAGKAETSTAFFMVGKGAAS
jgi:VWFA-related protein